MGMRGAHAWGTGSVGGGHNGHVAAASQRHVQAAVEHCIPVVTAGIFSMTGCIVIVVMVIVNLKLMALGLVAARSGGSSEPSQQCSALWL